MSDLTPSIHVRKPGMLTTVQDLGRPGFARFGVPPGGALDRGALILGNRLVGNDPDAAALEITLVGPEIGAVLDTVVAITGADLQPTVDGTPVPMWEPVLIPAGGTLSFSQRRPRTYGARTYLCLAGGIDVPVVMGARATDLTGRFGGLAGRAVRTGDRIPLLPASAAPLALLRNRLAGEPPLPSSDLIARTLAGPQVDRFTKAGIATFFGSEGFTVSSRSDRMGVRLSGPPVEHVRGADLLSEGIAHGAVQVPGDGQPIVLLASRQTVGGYVKIGTVCGADLDQIGQRCPGDRIRFQQIGLAEAQDAGRAQRERHGPAAVRTQPRPTPGWSEADTRAISQLAQSWTPDEALRLTRAVQRLGIRRFRLDIDQIGLHIDIDRRD